MNIRSAICGNENNIINCINDVSGGTGPFFGFIGFAGMFAVPLIIRSAFFKKSEGYGLLSRLLVLPLFAVWLVALYFLFPGITFCSVYCFLGIGLPLLGVALSVFGLCRIIELALSKPSA